ncbi:MAG: YraN family protein [Pseudomonadota bacterium]
MSGSVSYHAGLSAEETVGKRYTDAGYTIAANRFRGKGGEIDLIAERDGTVVFIEVKKSKTHEAAAARLMPRQIARLYATASEYLAHMPNGQDTDSRFDVALVDGTGRVDILENALAA